MTRVEAFYDNNAPEEWSRMDRHPMEFAITRRVLKERLPAPPACVIDIGGGPGRYAIWLAEQGYSVTLVDLAHKNLEFAKEKAREAEVELAGTIHVDARDLSAVPSASFDAALLMGPLYHLTDPGDRLKALREARRLVAPNGPDQLAEDDRPSDSLSPASLPTDSSRTPYSLSSENTSPSDSLSLPGRGAGVRVNRAEPGKKGVVFAAFIGRFAPYLDMAQGFPKEILKFRERYDRFTATGIHIPQAGEGFTDAWFALPAEIPPLMAAAGLEVLELRSAEGFIVTVEDHLAALDTASWEAWVEVNYRLGTEPSLLGAAGHLLRVGRPAVSP